MKGKLFQSFRIRLFFGLLVGSLIPMLACSAMLLQIFRLQMVAAAEETTTEQMKQIASSMDTVSDGLTAAAETIANDPVILRALVQPLEESTQIYTRLYEITDSHRSYARFDLYDKSGQWCYSTQSNPSQTQLSTSWGILYAASHCDSLTYSVCADAPDGSGPLYQGALMLTDSNGLTVGYLVVSLSSSHFQNILGNNSQTRLLLLNRYWRPVYCSQSDLAISLAPQLRQQLINGPIPDQTDSYIYHVSYHEAFQLYMVLQYTDVFSQDTMRLLYTISLGSALTCIVISILVSLTLSRQIIKPIRQLNKAISEVAKNNLDVYVSPCSNDELSELSVHFNTMVSALKHNQEELVERQRELNQAQIRMLQAQLSPHFLCNTLDTIKWIGKINQVPQVAEMATNLADILRFCISPEEFVTLDRELDMVKSYIEIQKIRLSSEFTFSVHISPSLANCLVPKMILQPIVENAILHGINDAKQGAIHLTIDMLGRGDLLRIMVKDNGHGFPEHMTGSYSNQDIQSLKGHLGLYNVHTILQKHYGKKFGLHLANQADGTCATVVALLPIRRKEKNSC